MRGRIAIVSLGLVTLWCSSLEAENIADARHLGKSLMTLAIRVQSLPMNRIATGMFLKIPDSDSCLFFVTNKHILTNSDSLVLTVPIIDTARNVVNTLRIVLPSYDSAGSLSYVIPEDSLDLAMSIVIKRKFSGLKKVYFSSLPDSWVAGRDDLFAGQPVVFYGYPLGIAVNQFEALARKGSISGIDTIANVIYLDADAFGGSSGSPVFVDFLYDVNLELSVGRFRPFIGIISAYRPYTKMLRNVETGLIEMVQTENSGLAIVVPATAISELCQSALSDLMQSGNCDTVPK